MIIVRIILTILLSMQIIAFGLFRLLLLDDSFNAFGLLDYYDFCYWIIRIICIIMIIVIIASQFKICVDLILKKTLFDTALFCTIY